MLNQLNQLFGKLRERYFPLPDGKQ